MMRTKRTAFPDLESILEQVEILARDVIAAEAAEVDAKGQWPEAGLRALQEMGLGGLVVPREAGGLGYGLEAVIRVCEVIGRACASTGLCYGMHCVATAVIAAKATPDQQRRYLEPIARGEHFTTLALSEPSTGAHFYFPQARLEKVSGDAYRINGAKAFVTNGSHADSYVVSTMAADPNAPSGEFSCVVLREGTEGMTWGKAWAGIGMRGNSSRNVELNNVTIPRSDLLGEEGDEIWYVFHVVAPYFLCAMAGTYLGLAGAALDEAVKHMQERTYGHSGKLLGEIAVLQHRLGVLWGVVERTRRLVYFAGVEADAGGPEALPALCAAKAEVADCVVDIANEAMTLMGGKAYAENSIMSRILRDARASHVMAPTTDMLRTWIGRVLLNQPILGD